jgi:hypothetical protein
MRTSLPAAALACAALVSLVSGSPAHAQSPEIPTVNVANAWFKPTLTRNDDPICEPILKETVDRFMTPEPIQLPEYEEPGPLAGLTRVERGTLKEESPGEWILPGREGPMYMRFDRDSGCGGACESESLRLSNRPLPGSSVVAQTPFAPEWALYTDGSGNYFAVSWADGMQLASISVYRLTQTASLKLSCQMKMAPTEQEAPAAARTLREESLLPFQRAVHALMGGVGWCGTMRTHDHWMGDVENATFQTLFRPWAMQDEIRDEHGTYDKDLLNLDLWSLNGLVQYETLTAYRTQFERTRSALASFYAAQFRLQPRESMSLATKALEATASTGIRFYSYSPPFKDKSLRRAILERRALREIREIPLDPAAQDAGSEDSVLNIAIPYPEALRYLLEKGFDPNKPNAFGKTPLMYAAQRNQVEALKILLEHGADVDAATTRPPDSCYFTLETEGMTALHYAVRYASEPFIRMLMEHGASTSFSATGRNSGTPLEWLQKYTAIDAPERNPNLPAEAVPALVAAMQVP